MRLAGRCEERRIEPTGYLIRSDLGRFSRRKRSASACFGRSREFAEATRMRFLRKSLLVGDSNDDRFSHAYYFFQSAPKMNPITIAPATVLSGCSFAPRI